MIRVVAAIAACIMLAACTTTNTKLATNSGIKPPAGSRVVLVRPDIELAVLTASGVQEPRADWSEAARNNIAAEIEGELKARSHAYSTMDPDEAMGGKVGQLLRLHGAVGASILYYSALPTKKDGFDWTLGEGAQAISSAYDADYALFVTGRGSYASGGRVATMIGLSLVGVSVPLGGQNIIASLVDLKTGQVVWFNFAIAGPAADMREQPGADSLVSSLLKDIPL